MSRTPWVVGAAALVLMHAGAGSASAAVSCSYNAGAKELDLQSTGFEEGIAVHQQGSNIKATNDVMVIPLTCTGGTPTVTNTDTIHLTGTGESPYAWPLGR